MLGDHTSLYQVPSAEGVRTGDGLFVHTYCPGTSETPRIAKRATKNEAKRRLFMGKPPDGVSRSECTQSPPGGTYHEGCKGCRDRCTVGKEENGGIGGDCEREEGAETVVNGGRSASAR